MVDWYYEFEDGAFIHTCTYEIYGISDYEFACIISVPGKEIQIELYSSENRALEAHNRFVERYELQLSKRRRRRKGNR